MVYLDLFCRGVGEKTNKFAQAYYKVWASQVAQWVKNLPAVQETKVLEDPLEEGMATYSSIVAWESHGQKNLAGYSPQGRKE